MLTGRHILVGGGGGSSKTGVANGFVGNLAFIERSIDLWVYLELLKTNLRISLKNLGNPIGMGSQTYFCLMATV
ncbi:hypothetical protein Trydic_g10409 [Trypoxylus dichotomus]